MDKMSVFKRVIVLAPHTDDGELGAGGTIARLIEQGSEVWYVAFSIAEDSLPEGMPKNTLELEVREATKSLGIDESRLIVKKYGVRRMNYHRQDILEDLVELKSIINPDMVLMPSPCDLHQDHATVSAEGLRAFKTTTILGYELMWNNLDFRTMSFVKLDDAHIEIKCDALKAYKSQEGRVYMSDEYIKALAHVRGVQIGVKYAECFEVIRWVV